MVTVKNNIVYVKVDGNGFHKKLFALKENKFRYNPETKLWYAPISKYDIAVDIDAENTFTKEENDEADIWYEEWSRQFSVKF